jgi:hypothetical protein
MLRALALALAVLVAPTTPLATTKLTPGEPVALTTPFAVTVTLGDDEALQVVYTRAEGAA